MLTIFFLFILFFVQDSGEYTVMPMYMEKDPKWKEKTTITTKMSVTSNAVRGGSLSATPVTSVPETNIPVTDPVITTPVTMVPEIKYPIIDVPATTFPMTIDNISTVLDSTVTVKEGRCGPKDNSFRLLMQIKKYSDKEIDEIDTEERRETKFKKHDKDSNGKMSYEEWLQWQKEVVEIFGPDNLEDIFGWIFNFFMVFDENRDGEISFKEVLDTRCSVYLFLNENQYYSRETTQPSPFSSITDSSATSETTNSITSSTILALLPTHITPASIPSKISTPAGVTSDNTPMVSKDTCHSNMDCCKFAEDKIIEHKVISKEMCTTVKVEVCDNVTEEKVKVMPKKDCENVAKKECNTKANGTCNIIYEKKCEDGKTEYKKECKIVYNQKCEDTINIKYEQKCLTNYEAKCNGYGYDCEQFPKEICKMIPVAEPYRSCYDVPKKECKSVPYPTKQQKCHNVPKTECIFVPDAKCIKHYEEKCRYLPKSFAVQTPPKKCYEVPIRECKIVESTEPLYHKKTKKVCQTCKTVTLNESSIVYDKIVKESCKQIMEKKCKIKPDTNITPETTTNYKARNVCKTTYNTEYKKECKTIFQNICEDKEKTEYKEICKKCLSVSLKYPHQNCMKVPYKVSYNVCKKLPKQQCKQIAVQNPSKKCTPVQEYKLDPGTKSEQKLKENCFYVPSRECTSITIDTPRRVLTNETKNYCIGKFRPQPAP